MTSSDGCLKVAPKMSFINIAALKSLFTVTESRKVTTGSELCLDSGGVAVLIDRCPSEGCCSQSVSVRSQLESLN